MLLERFAAARIRAGNSSEDRETGNFVGAEFLHGRSRALDPQLQRPSTLAVGHGSRVVLSGDTGQHASVSRGDALRILDDHSRYSFGQLSTIRRQRRADYLQAVTLAAERQPARALDRFDSMGEIIEQSAGKNSANPHSRTANPLACAFDGSNPSLPTPPARKGGGCEPQNSLMEWDCEGAEAAKKFHRSERMKCRMLA